MTKRLLVISFFASFAAGCVGAGGEVNAETSAVEVDEPKSAGAPTLELPKNAAVLDVLPDVVEASMPAVVGIATKRVVQMRSRAPMQNPFFSPFFRMPDQPQEREQQGQGSGVIVTVDGIVLTNNHVIDKADEIEVKLDDDRTFEAEVVGRDPESDIAVLQIKDSPDDLKPLAFGDSDSIRLGQSVVAIGNPFGLSGTVTLGIVSAKGRANVGIVDYEDFIQTDAAINPGNSGGALVNMKGELIGINTAILSRSGGYQGIGFAIPSNMAQSILNNILEDGKVSRGWLGVGIQTLDSDLTEAFGFEKDLKGVLVSDVTDDSPAARAGFERGDVIVKFDGKRVQTAAELRNQVAIKGPNATVEIELLRDGKSRTVSVTLGDLARSSGVESPETEAGELMGLKLVPVRPDVKSQFNLPEQLDKGVVVTELDPQSEAARLGLRPGDVVLEVNKTPVSSVKEFEVAYGKTRDKVLFLVLRERGTVYLAVPKP